MSGTGHGALAVGRKAHSETRGEATLHAAVEACVEFGEHIGGMGANVATVRAAPTMSETVMAALRPLPLTSPSRMSVDPADSPSRGMIWKKSPPTS